MIAASMRTLALGTDNADGTVTGVTTGTSQPFQVSDSGALAVYFRSIGTTSGGTILIEEADWGPLETVYTGTWIQVASVTANSFTGGAQAVTRPTIGEYAWVRIRISATITGGGSITVALRAQGNA